MKPSQQDRNWREVSLEWFQSPMVLVCIPVLIVGILLVWPVFSELEASRQIKNELRLVAEEGFPTTEAEIESEFMAKTFTEGTLVMNRIETRSRIPTHTGRSLTLPYLDGDVQPLADLIPGVHWPEEARAAEFLLHIQPLLDEVGQLEKFPQPIWMPRLPADDLYEKARIARPYHIEGVLRLAFDHAVYHQDSERAMQVLRSLGSLHESTDWRSNAYEDAILHSKQSLYAMVNRSMVSGIWSKSQLQELRRQVEEPLDLAQRWRRIIALGTVGYSQWVDSRGLMDIPSEVLQVIRAQRYWRTFFDGSFESVGQRIHKLTVPMDFTLTDPTAYDRVQNKRESDLMETFLPSLGFHMIEDLFSVELMRRQTLVLIAIKEYQMVNGNWPRQLDELEAFGLTADDWSPPGRQEWKYEFDELEARLSSVVKPIYKIRTPGTATKFQEVIRIR
jgi:hypothetical protein